MSVLILSASVVAEKDWGHFGGAQILLNFPLTSKPIAGQVNSYFKYSHFMMPSQDFHQGWLYAGASRGVVTIYTGGAFNWQARDLAMFGIMLDIPQGPFMFSTEVDYITGENDLYLWSGVDYNFHLGQLKCFVGPQVEMIKTDLACAQTGLRVGIENMQIAGYFGDQSYNVRLSLKVPLEL
ncbi:hypothetical protein C4546_03335 [Candidatus Parcubacteria bacterium]|nr:MAG: hypothetical protein C4546_03335 [Candidatus Parcubacteria bacterium]